MSARLLVVVALSACSIAMADDPKAAPKVDPSKPAVVVPATPATPATAAQPAKAATPAAPAAPDMKEIMKAMEEAAQPGAEHAAMATMAGDWDVSMKYLDWSDPSMQKWNESKGEEKCEVVLGGRYVFGIFKGEFNGQKFEGRGFHGFNKATKQFESSWVDTMSTCQLLYTGTMSSDNMLRMSATYTDPATGAKRESRMVSKIIDANTREFSMYEVEGGQEMKVMEAKYTRKGTAAKPAASVTDKATDAVKAAEKKVKDAKDAIKALEPTK